MSDYPQEILEDLATAADNDECVYINRKHPDDVYVWAREDEDADESMFVILERTRSGTWMPLGRPVTEDRALKFLGGIEDETLVEIRPQTKLPPGRHDMDQ